MGRAEQIDKNKSFTKKKEKILKNEQKLNSTASTQEKN